MEKWDEFLATTITHQRWRRFREVTGPVTIAGGGGQDVANPPPSWEVVVAPVQRQDQEQNFVVILEPGEVPRDVRYVEGRAVRAMEGSRIFSDLRRQMRQFARGLRLEQFGLHGCPWGVA